ncbi:hypothetical protein F4604DRAFT_1680325 [Suillus subluteus]|nr:hypothetical protein F4604DRAFT_1680325 [Suillus subluteus]
MPLDLHNEIRGIALQAYAVRDTGRDMAPKLTGNYGILHTVHSAVLEVTSAAQEGWCFQTFIYTKALQTWHRSRNKKKIHRASHNHPYSTAAPCKARDPPGTLSHGVKIDLTDFVGNLKLRGLGPNAISVIDDVESFALHASFLGLELSQVAKRVSSGSKLRSFAIRANVIIPFGFRDFYKSNLASANDEHSRGYTTPAPYDKCATIEGEWGDNPVYGMVQIRNMVLNW